MTQQEHLELILEKRNEVDLLLNEIKSLENAYIANCAIPKDTKVKIKSNSKIGFIRDVEFNCYLKSQLRYTLAEMRKDGTPNRHTILAYMREDEIEVIND